MQYDVFRGLIILYSSQEARTYIVIIRKARMINDGESESFCRKAKRNLVQPKAAWGSLAALEGRSCILYGLKAAHVLLIII